MSKASDNLRVVGSRDSGAQTMRAVILDKSAEPRLGVLDVAQPQPATGEVLVRVKAFSLNAGEVRNALASNKGPRPGWDFAGFVERAADDNSGPPQGARVVGLARNSGAWAEQICVPSHALATLPDNVSFAVAAALPVAGLTALWGLERGGQLLGKRVLVTGASGGVGRYACRLAVLSGARVTATLRKPDLAPQLKAEGVHEVLIGNDPALVKQSGRYAFILEVQGGQSLATSLTMLEPGGTCLLCGNASSENTTFEARDFYRPGSVSLKGFYIFAELEHRAAGDGLRTLVALVESGALVPPIDAELSWEDIDSVARRFAARQITGKVVLRIGD